MSTAAPTNAQAELRRRRRWAFWMFVTIGAPLGGLLVAVAAHGALGDGVPWGVSVAIGVGALAVAFGAVEGFSDVSPRLAFGGFLLSAVLTVPWIYAFVIAALIVSCTTGNGCLD